MPDDVKNALKMIEDNDVKFVDFRLPIPGESGNTRPKP